MQAVIKRTLFHAWALLGACVLLGAVAGTANAAEPLPTITSPGPQTSTVNQTKTIVVTGTNLHSLTAKNLPAGVPQPTEVKENEWKIEGAPKTAETATITLEAENAEGKAGTQVTFTWTVNISVDANPGPPENVETPAKPPEAPSKPSEPAPKVTSAGRLGTMPIQKPGRQLVASFLCEVQSCTVTISGVITAGKKKFKVHSAATKIAQGKKVQIPLKLSKSQRAVITAALKKHKKVLAALSATIHSSVGYQVTKALSVSVKS